eukprot:3941664-Rhodomonas_salina.3
MDLSTYLYPFPPRTTAGWGRPSSGPAPPSPPVRCLGLAVPADSSPPGTATVHIRRSKNRRACHVESGWALKSAAGTNATNERARQPRASAKNRSAKLGGGKAQTRSPSNRRSKGGLRAEQNSCALRLTPLTSENASKSNGPYLLSIAPHVS